MQSASQAVTFSKFRTLLVLLVLLPMVPVFALHIFRNLEQTKAEQSLLQERVVTLSRLIAANEAAFVKHAQQQLATLAEFPFLVLATNEPFCATHLANLLKLSPDYLNFGLIESDGTLFASSVASAPESRNFSDRSYFKRTMQTRRFSIGDYQVGRITGQRALNFGFPILGVSNQVERVLFSSLKLELLSEAAARIELPQGAAVTILDKQGTVLSRLPESREWVGKSLINSAFVAKALETRDGLIHSMGLDGVKRLYAVTSVSDGESPSLFVTVGMPTSLLFAATNQRLAVNILILSAVTVISILLASLLAERMLVRPVKELVVASNCLAEGDLTRRTEIRQHTAEFREVATAFNAMAERLQTREADLQQATQQIQQLNVQLEDRVQERTHQLEEANKELEAFSYSVSHDLRAPLRHLDGFAQLLLKHDKERLSDKGKRYLDVIAQAAKKMGTLIDELLLFSRMGRQPLTKADVDSNKLVQEVRSELQGQAHDQGVAWTIAELPPVRADAGLLRQVWINLLSNAVKYSGKQEKPRIEVGACESADKREKVFFVRDNGVGFNMAFVNKLFGVFQRLHADHEFEGTGIGLANVRRIVHRHEGRVWAEAKTGEGATFYFSLPA